MRNKRENLSVRGWKLWFFQFCLRNYLNDSSIIQITISLLHSSAAPKIVREEKKPQMPKNSPRTVWLCVTSLPITGHNPDFWASRSNGGVCFHLFFKLWFMFFLFLFFFRFNGRGALSSVSVVCFCMCVSLRDYSAPFKAWREKFSFLSSFFLLLFSVHLSACWGERWKVRVISEQFFFSLLFFYKVYRDSVSCPRTLQRAYCLLSQTLGAQVICRWSPNNNSSTTAPNNNVKTGFLLHREAKL